MSIKEDERLFCDSKLLISRPEITAGWQWLKIHQKKGDNIEIKGKYYVKSSEASDDKKF